MNKTIESIKFKNKFRIRYNGKVLALNSITNAKGYNQFVEGFDTLDEAVSTRRFYASIRGLHEEDLVVEPYSETIPHQVPAMSIEASDYFKKAKTFSGRGLRLKNLESKHNNKYSPDKYYGGEVSFAQSAERNKGLSINAKTKPKKKVFNATETWGKVKNIVNDGAMTLEFSLVESLRKKEMGKKALRRYLRERGYSVAQSIAIGVKVFDKD